MAFQMDKLTIKAQEAVGTAQTIAAEHGNPAVEPLHLLAALLGESEGIVAPVIDKIGVDRGRLAGIVESELGRLPKMSGGAQPQAGQPLIAVLEAAQKTVAEMKDEFVSTEHLLLALAKADAKTAGILELGGIREKDILAALQTIRGSARVTDQNPEEKFQALDRYGIDLVARAQQGKLDPVACKSNG